MSAKRCFSTTKSVVLLPVYTTNNKKPYNELIRSD